MLSLHHLNEVTLKWPHLVDPFPLEDTETTFKHDYIRFSPLLNLLCFEDPLIFRLAFKGL